MNTWRELSMPVVAKAIEEGRARGLEGRELQRFISGHYPFGQREMWPYKVWLSEVKRQLQRRRTDEPKRSADLPGQGLLFGE